MKSQSQSYIFQVLIGQFLLPFPMEGRTSWTWSGWTGDLDSGKSVSRFPVPCTCTHALPWIFFGGKLYQFHPIHMGKPCETPPANPVKLHPKTLWNSTLHSPTLALHLQKQPSQRENHAMTWSLRSPSTCSARKAREKLTRIIAWTNIYTPSEN